MTNPASTAVPQTALDLDAILAKAWTDEGDFTAKEFERARALYASMRAHDARLLTLREAVATEVAAWTGCTPRDVGSLGIRCNLEASDLDLGISYPVDRRDHLMQALAPHTRFLAERRTSYSTTRLVFAFEREGVEVDLSALTPEDFAVATRMLDQIDSNMTETERVAYTWVKHLLRASGDLERYAAWKLVTYARFCPEFDWQPIPEKAKPTA
ncbi:hypothetical protein GCM10023205_78890 [Yinghuangia aomiensis]|uniref:Nucleotidyltransferase domain-containing protein n=1 Tax=Yinghuangia aomiensis TaxID=676205 RepID=A0ABP9IC66_9ACTN